MIQPIHLEFFGTAGRPSIEINKDWLLEANSADRRLTYTSMSRILGIHRNTLRRKMHKLDIPPRYADMSDTQLEELLCSFQDEKNTSGRRYAEAYLQARGYRVKKWRIRLALHRVRGLVSILCIHKAIDCRKYSVPHSNYLWHCDGHHKLIRWGVVIHGVIDGYCRTV